MTNCLCEILAIVGGYLVGAIPIGPLVAQWYGVHDLQKRGSGNSGATNVGRVLGWQSFLIVFFADGAKAFLYLSLLKWLAIEEGLLLGSAAALLVGNCYSIFLEGKGGKGVATSVGILATLAPYWLLGVLPLWAFIFKVSGRVGIGSCGSALGLFGLALYHFNQVSNLSMLVIGIALLIMMRHRSNLKEFFQEKF